MTPSLRKRDRIHEHLIAPIESRAAGKAIHPNGGSRPELEIARPTLRSVVDELITTGLQVREHGRGVFVRTPKIAQQIVDGPTSGGAA